MSQQQQPHTQLHTQPQQQQQRVGGFKVKKDKTKRKSGASQTSQRSVPRPGGLAAILAGGKASSAEVQDLMFQLS
jgi:hypothetical protein